MNASRMARMVGGLTSVMGSKGQSTQYKRLNNAKSGHDLRQPRTPVEHTGNSFIGGGGFGATNGGSMTTRAQHESMQST